VAIRFVEIEITETTTASEGGFYGFYFNVKLAAVSRRRKVLAKEKLRTNNAE